MTPDEKKLEAKKYIKASSFYELKINMESLELKSVSNVEVQFYLIETKKRWNKVYLVSCILTVVIYLTSSNCIMKITQSRFCEFSMDFATLLWLKGNIAGSIIVHSCTCLIMFGPSVFLFLIRNAINEKLYQYCISILKTEEEKEQEQKKLEKEQKNINPIYFKYVSKHPDY